MTGPVPESPQDLVAAYALGALSADDARRVEALLAASPEARLEVQEYREVAALLALASETAAPDAGLRARVMARIGQDTPATVPAPSGGRSGRGAWLALAASLILAVGLGAALLSARGRLGAVEHELVAREAALAETARALAQRETTLNAILEPGVQLFQLTASGDPDPGIQLFWNRQQHRAIVNAFRLKPVPQGRAYQLWFIKDGKPVPSVTFRPGADGHARIESVAVPGDGSVSAAAVTIEPEAGSAQPTSPILLMGSLQKS